MNELIEINWSKLKTAYGKADEIPLLLEKLKDYPNHDDYQAEPFYSLWSSLCHQGDIYSASYAAVPFIVNCISQNPTQTSYDYFLLPVCIEISRLKGMGPKIPPELEDAYLNSLTELKNLVHKIPKPNEIYVSVLAASIAVCNGNEELAEVILELNSETISEFKEWQAEQ